MRFQKIIIASVLNIASVASAVVPCDRSYESPANVHQINIIGPKDMRRGTSAGVPGMSKAESDFVSQAAVEMRCPAIDGSGDTLVSSGFVVGDPGLICGSKHPFFEKATNKPIADLTKCKATNKNFAESKSSSLLFTKGNYKAGETTGENHSVNDFLCVRLAVPMLAVRPIQIDESGKAINNREMFMISGAQSRMTSPAQVGEAIGEKCRNEGIAPQGPSDSTSFFISCSFAAKASGSMVLTRSKDTGELVLAGIASASGKDSLDYEDFSLETGSFTWVQGADGPLLKTIKQLTRSRIPAPAKTLTSGLMGDQNI